MIFCHYQNINDQQIRAAVDWMRAADPDTLITPGKVYRAMGKRADCGGCLPLFPDTLSERSSFGMATADQPLSQSFPNLGTGTQDEGRPHGHRRSERGAAV